jgi:hypothetical protein
MLQAFEPRVRLGRPIHAPPRPKTDVALPARHSDARDFRLGRVFHSTTSVLSRHFMLFVMVNGLAAAPVVLLEGRLRFTAGQPGGGGDLASFWLQLLLIMLVTLALEMPSQAAILHAAFQDMGGRPVSMVDSIRVAMRRFFPVIGVAIVVILVLLLLAAVWGGASSALIWFTGWSVVAAAVSAAALPVIAAFFLATMWFVAMPACVVERTGPFASLGRSRRLTKGCRWPIFGIFLATMIAEVIVATLTQQAVALPGGAIVVLVVRVIWYGVRNTVNATVAAAAYRELRLAKEGDQVATVFE